MDYLNTNIFDLKAEIFCPVFRPLFKIQIIRQPDTWTILISDLSGIKMFTVQTQPHRLNHPDGYSMYSKDLQKGLVLYLND